VRLIVEIQTVGDKFVEIDFRRSFAAPLAGSPRTAPETLFTAAITTSVPAPLASSVSPSILGSSTARLTTASILTRWTIFAFLALFRFLLFNFRHFDSFRLPS
jgi:hypothetical protein